MIEKLELQYRAALQNKKKKTPKHIHHIHGHEILNNDLNIYRHLCLELTFIIFNTTDL